MIFWVEVLVMEEEEYFFYLKYMLILSPPESLKIDMKLKLKELLSVSFLPVFLYDSS